MNNKTFILLSRSILDSEVFASQKLLKIWIWCLCKANHKDNFVPITTGRGQTTVKVKRGQFLFGRHKAEEELIIDGSTIYKIMKRLELLGNIKIKSNSHYSVITICNYGTYQSADSYKVTGKEQPSNRQVTGKSQASNTNNNVKNVNNEKKREQFVKWLDYRKDIKKAITVESTFNSLVKIFNSEPIEKIEWVVNHSIQNGYQGLFWEKYKAEPTGEPKKKVDHHVYKCPVCQVQYKRRTKGNNPFPHECETETCKEKMVNGMVVGHSLEYVDTIYRSNQ